MEGKEDHRNNIFKKILNKMPVLKYIFIIIVLFVFFYLGILFKDSFLTHTKTTQFGLKDVGELVTQTAYVTVVEDSKTNRDFFNLFDIPFTESRQIFSYDVEVDASIDFSKITFEPKKDENKIVVKLPHAKIYKSTLNLFSLKIYLDSGNPFSRINLEKQNDALKEIEKQAVADSIANGILESADKHGKALIDGLIKGNNTYKDYTIIYEYIGG